MAFALSLLATPLAGLHAQQPPPAASQPAATIVLPPVLVQGEPATLAALDSDGHPRANVSIALGGVTLTTDPTGRAAFVAPDAAGVLRATLPDGSGEVTTLVIAAAVPRQALCIDSVERVILLKRPADILGAGFSGVADENHVVLGNLPAAVLAASPAALVVLPNPHTALGDTSLSVRLGELAASFGPVAVVALEFTSTKPKGQAGEKGELRVTAHGTDRAIDFEVRASPPGRIELSGAKPRGAKEKEPVARGRTSGGEENTAVLPFTFRSPGAFDFELRLVPEPRGLPDTDAAQRELFTALDLAPPAWQKRVHHVLELVVAHPQDVREARDTLEKMLAEKPEGEFGRHLEAAWRILLNRE